MSFSAGWLALREPYDARARNVTVLEAVVASLGALPSIRVVDLACGTGSTLRALAPRLSTQQHWRLVDNDLSLLARASETACPQGVAVAAVPLDLNRDLEAVLDGPVDLVTTSALLDLVSQDWLERLAVEIAARADPALCGAELRRPPRFRSQLIRSIRPSLPRSTHINGQIRVSGRHWGRPRPRPRSRALNRSAIPSFTAHPTGVLHRTTARFRPKS